MATTKIDPRKAAGEISVAERLMPILEAQRTSFLAGGPPTLAERQVNLQALKQATLQYSVRFVQAVNEDFGNRSRQETSYMDLMPVLEGITYLQKNLEGWMQPEERHVPPHFQPGTARVAYQPLGVIGVISPWNYPITLALGPLAAALAAGNRVMIKPFEFTPKTSALLASMLSEIFDESHVTVVTGDASVGAAFSSLPFDRILFTGSTPVGRAVMRSASDHLVPVTLELGGKSPVIVERGSSLQSAAYKIAFGKLANSGQTCIAPDYVLVAEEELDDFVSAFIAETGKLYPNIATNPDYATVINDRHYSRLRGLVDDARSKGARIWETASSDQKRTHARTFLPVVVSGVTDQMAIETEEIFGPILMVVPYRTLSDAIAYINARPRPLALYYFGSDQAAQNQVLGMTTSGNVTVNDTLLHFVQDDLPFGGVGASGMGAYHGHEGFKTMSHAKGIFTQSDLNITNSIRPPFGKAFDRAVTFLMG